MGSTDTEPDPIDGQTLQFPVGALHGLRPFRDQFTGDEYDILELIKKIAAFDAKIEGIDLL